MAPSEKKITRRKMLLGITTLAFGASGFIASGSLAIGSEGSLGDDWVQVQGTDQTVEFSPQQLGDADEDGSSGDGGASGDDDDETPEDDDEEEEETEGEEDEGQEDEVESEEEEEDDDTSSSDDTGDDDDDDDEDGEDDDELETRIQVVTEPNNPGNAVNGSGSASWDGELVESDIILSTDAGFFRGLGVRNVNRNATSRLGRLTGSGYPDDLVAFLIANVGPENGAEGATASVNALLYSDGETMQTDQLRFPYRVVDSSGNSVAAGEDLTEDSIELPDGHVIEIVVIVDTTGGFNQLERIDTLRFNASEVT